MVNIGEGNVYVTCIKGFVFHSFFRGSVIELKIFTQNRGFIVVKLGKKVNSEGKHYYLVTYG